MVVLRYLKSYIGDSANRYEEEKQRRWRLGAGGGGVGGWHYIFPIYDFALHSTTWTPRTDSVAKWPRHDATLEGGGFFERGVLMERGGLLTFFY